MLKNFRNILAVVIILNLVACYPITVKEGKRSLKKVRYLWPKFKDDLDTDSLVASAQRSMEYFDRLNENNLFYFGTDTFSVGHVKKSLSTFLQIIQKKPTIDLLNRKLRKKFLLYRATGLNWDNQVLFTGYFEPTFEGSTEKGSIYKYPLYVRPNNLFNVDLGLFRHELHGQRLMGRIEGKNIVPYYERKDIVEGKALKEQNLEIAWLKDPLDVAILQIQGSGMVKLTNGEIVNVGYSATNGHPYKSIGKYMIDKGYIKRENLSLQTISSYLNDHPDKKKEILNYNPSYVFFTINDEGPLGSISVPLTPGRSLAVDSRLFPKGALVYIKCRKPIIGEDGSITGWMPFSRFLLNQDTGGAIKGPGRADIFWGNGPYAEMTAGHLKHFGEMYFLVMKPDS